MYQGFIQDTLTFKKKTFSQLMGASFDDIRSAMRSSQYTGQTAGLASGKLQTNLVVMPAGYAEDFLLFCKLNPKPCPLVGYSQPGDPLICVNQAVVDVRVDVPRYCLFTDGVLKEEYTDIVDIWRKDFVAFALGCSFTFEHALLREGIELWHIANNKTVPMFRSNIVVKSAGPFSGKNVVSMRLLPEKKLDRVIEITSRYQLAHGEPLHVGNPQEIGITDLSKPDWGDPVPVAKGCIPVFWACGVTPQVAIEAAKVPIAITHKPGHMLIFDVDENEHVVPHT